MMRRLIWAGAFLIGLAGGAGAQQLSVRSGEHDGFSRLVIPYPRGTKWTIEDGDGGISLRASGGSFTYDIRDVFRLIPRNRVLSVVAGTDNNTLFIKTGEKIRSKAYQLDGGQVVIDFADAEAAPPGDVQSAGRIGIPEHLDLLWKNHLPLEDTDNIAQTGSPRGENPPNGSARVSAAERQLLESLSRAASQGLISVDPTRKIPKPATGSPLAEGDPADDGSLPIPLRSETVYDRDLDQENAYPRLLVNGQSCLPDDRFAVENWVTDDPPTDQLAERQNGLIGEFDRPDPAAVERLARLYIALGFGAEAKATLAAFDIGGAIARPLVYMADVIDGTPTPPDEPISHMAACDGKVALWAFMGGGLPADSGQIDVTAIQSSYSALPPQIRDILGPVLVERFLKIGQPDAAEAIRNALRRTSSAENAPLAIAQAQLLLASGQPLAAEESLSAAPVRNDLNSAQSLVLSVEARLMRGQAIDRKTRDDIAAQMHQTGASELGQRLRRALILAEGSVGGFDNAFDTLAGWPQEGLDDLRDQTLGDLIAQLGRVPDDLIFVRQMFTHRQVLQDAPLPAALRISLADRLSGLGFSAAAADILTATVRQTATGRLALARAAIAERDGAAALAHLDGLDGEAAAQLRAQAYLALGEHANAAALFRMLGDEQETARAAWRGASWDIVKDHGSDIERAVIEDATADNASDPIPTGPISRANALITRSQEERALLDRLLTAY
ncbi:hypothetical protein [Paenirhodobacter populi]|uniref:HEAT repeat domain-containing protein n=1 Tax=Paenirhodobacter populi TaxID=2306993 RepID=A0A443JQ55_9RHOB|nr:hypothetical protein [Sinirhodobacter populi]RWR22627.1 hypothetical protein D2T30_06720 [Sinirhodobacter populi]